MSMRNRIAVNAALFCITLFCAFGAAQAEPASDGQIKAIFTAIRVDQFVDDAIKFVEESKAREIEKETDPEKKESLQRLQGNLGKFLRDELSWGKIEPLAISAYQKYYTAEDAELLLGFFKTPLGVVYTDKYVPASYAAWRQTMT